MTYKEAVSIANKKEPKLTVLYISEQEDQFLLVMGDKNGSPILNSSVLVVNKETKSCEWVNTMLHYSQINKPILNRYKP